MPRQALPVTHYENKLYQKYGISYHIIPTEYWHGVRTNVEIACPKHLTKRVCWLQKIFNGRLSIVPCRQCYLDSLKSKSLNLDSLKVGSHNRRAKLVSNAGSHPPTDSPPTGNDLDFGIVKGSKIVVELGDL